MLDFALEDWQAPVAPVLQPRRRTARQDRGQRAYHAGVSAESSASRYYRGRGCAVAAERWRGQGGEIDLIVRDGPVLVFVEVKCARDHATAAERLGERQMRRLCSAAEEYLGTQPLGAHTEMRFDVALVDATGALEIRENAFGAM